MITYGGGVVEVAGGDVGGADAEFAGPVVGGYVGAGVVDYSSVVLV